MTVCATPEGRGMEIKMQDEMKLNKIEEFTDVLSSKAPTPGGGGASALAGAIGASLGCMVSNLTIGKKKYASVENDIKEALQKLEVLRDRMLSLIDEDARAFAPLAAAYSLPKDTPKQIEIRNNVMKTATEGANQPPLKIVDTAIEIIDVLDILAEKGSIIALSDVGCAVVNAKAALEGAILNVYINKGSVPVEKIEKAKLKADRIYNKVVGKIS